jgi:hypothetical protein
METVNAAVPGVKTRILSLVDVLLEDSSLIPKVYQGVISNLIKGQLKKTNDAQLMDVLLKLENEIIPFIKNGEIPK